MQHHGVPTRLLDWSWSPYVAAYFAVRDADKFVQSDAEDGVVWYLNNDLVTENKDRAVEAYKARLGVSTIGYADLLVDRNAPHVLLTAASALPNEREVLQRSFYSLPLNLIATHTDALESLTDTYASQSPSAVGKLVITASSKHEFKARLRRANVTAATLFPGLDGIGQDLTEFYK